MKPAWADCPNCDEYWCRLHGLHVYECPCPPSDEWPSSPYQPTPEKTE